MTMTTPDSDLMSGNSSTAASASQWDMSSANNSTLASAAASFNIWNSNPPYFGANTGFGGSNPYTPEFPTWGAHQWNPDSRFPMGRLAPNQYFINSIGAGISGAMRNSGRRRRNLFNQKQVTILKQAFDRETYVKPEHREMLAKETGLTPQQVKIWFQNNRYKCKQKSKEDERSHKGSRSDDMDRKYNNMDSPCSSGNDHSLNSNNSPDISSCVKLEDHSVIGDSSDIKPIMPYKDQGVQSSAFNGFNSMYPYQMSGMPIPFGAHFYPGPYQASSCPQTNVYNTTF